jgi:hypothetical protein
VEPYSVDINPEQVTRWIRAEHELDPHTLIITASRASEVREIPVRQELHLGDEEHEDLTEVATIGTLEIAPARQSDGWLLSVVVENEAGPRAPGRRLAATAEERIDLGTFYREFIRPGGGTADVIVEAEDADAEARVRDLLDRIERDYHGPA